MNALHRPFSRVNLPLMNILGIESSCDETAAAVVTDGLEVRSSVVASQIEVHHPYGGVVPELASRKHVEAVSTVVRRALKESGLGAEHIDAVAATQGPGLVGALLVGFSFAKAYAYARNLPFLGVDHLEGHLYSVLLSSSEIRFPYVALLASGGHTGIYHVVSRDDCRLLGQTRDDAVGEAYDKVAKMLDLGYPGGPVIDRLAATGRPEKVVFKRPYLDKSRFDFSFSGIKTAVRRYLEAHSTETGDQWRSDVAAGFQAAVIDVLAHKVFHAAEVFRCEHIAVVGGVAANEGLRSRLQVQAGEAGLSIHLPSLSLCGDNAAMVAATAYHHYRNGRRTPLDADVYSRQLLPQFSGDVGSTAYPAGKP